MKSKSTLLQRLAGISIFTVEEEAGSEPASRADILDFVRRFRPAGFMTSGSERVALSQLVRDLQAVDAEAGSPYPLIMCGDHRGGNSLALSPEGGGLDSPAPMALGTIPSEAQAIGSEVGAAMARDAMDYGLNLNLAPYADYLERDDIDYFMFRYSIMGSDARVNADVSAGLVRGMHQEGLLATYCTFPGGYGSNKGDPHFHPGTIRFSAAEVERDIFAAPKAAIAAGVDAVMLSHFAFPALDPSGAPATWSRVIIEEVLRKHLGFHGLIMTDAVGMLGVTALAGDGREVAIRALEAGADLILLIQRDDLYGMVEAVQSGRIPMRRLDEAYDRVLALRARLPRMPVASRSNPIAEDVTAMAALVRRCQCWFQAPRTPLLPTARLNVVTHRHAVVNQMRGAWPGDFSFVRLQPAWFKTEVLPAANLRVTLADSTPDDELLVVSECRADLQLAAALVHAGRRVRVMHIGPAYELTTPLGSDGLIATFATTPAAIRGALDAFLEPTLAQGRWPLRIRNPAFTAI